MTNQNLRILIIDDNTDIHRDFAKILGNETCQSEKDAKISSLETQIFGKASKPEEDDVQVYLPRFELQMACQGEEGIEKVRQALIEKKPFALAFVDIRMPPGLDGVETIKRIWQLDPQMQMVICTAYSDYSWEQTVAALGEKDNLLILKKPFDVVAVKQLACALTKKWLMMQELNHYAHHLEERVTERNQSLLKSISLMRATLESSAEAILVVDDEFHIKDYNQKLLDMFSLTKAEILDKHIDVLLNVIASNIKHPAAIDKMRKIMEKEEAADTGILRFSDHQTLEYHTQPYKLHAKTIGRIWSIRDITKRALLENELHYLATHDSLTGLPNRMHLQSRIKQLLAPSQRQHKKFAFLYLDLDRFKWVNDSINHEAGDEILKQVSQRISSVITKSDTLVRLGGDEFVIIHPDFADKAEIDNFAQEILTLFDAPYSVEDNEIMLSTSIGISIYPKDGKTLETLHKHADSAMYHAKQQGSNQFKYYTHRLNDKSIEKLHQENELRHAFTNNEFYLEYQPQYNLHTGELISVEALIRWRHPKKGIIYPTEFIPIAEESGLSIAIGEWVTRTACQQNKIWQDLGYKPIRVAVNVTAKQFRSPNFIRMVQNILSETGLKPEDLELELTENLILSNHDITKVITQLKRIGVQIVLDDFGTGCASLNYLRSIPIQRIKIDQSYIQNFDSNRGDSAIITGIIAMAKSLKLGILAEGVENQQQLNFLKNLKCEGVSGFYLSKPLSARECGDILQKRHPLLQDSLAAQLE